MFEMTEANVDLVHKNERKEKHGEEEVLACDLNFKWETSNGVLAMFAPELRHSLYKKPGDGQAELPGTDDPDHLTALRFPAMAPIKWMAGDLTGGLLTFHTGVKSLVKIDITRLHKFKLEPKEGGTVVVYFQVQCRPNEQQSGKLSKFYTDGACTITVTPPPAPEDLQPGDANGAP